MSSEHREDPDDVVVIVVEDWEGETDTTVRPVPEEMRKVAEEYLEKLKKWRPDEYEEIMRARRAREKGIPPVA